MQNTEKTSCARGRYGLAYLASAACIAVGTVAALSGCGGGGSGYTPSTASTAPPVTASAVENVEIYPDSVVIAGPHSDESVANYKIRVQGLNREFSFFRPSNPDRKKLPLVIDFHGAGSVVKNGFSNSAWLAIARSEKFLLLQPQALSGGQSFTYWNVGWDVGRDDVYFVRTLLDTIVTQQDVDVDRVYLTGMSSGGFMAFYAVQALQDRIAAVAPIAGTVMTTGLPTYTLKKPMPLLHIHGTADSTVDINGGGWYASWWQLRQIWVNANKISSDPVITPLPDNVKTDNSTVTKYAYRGATAASDIDDYLVINGNHSVPGIESYANQDINAYVLIWNFFKDRKLIDR